MARHMAFTVHGQSADGNGRLSQDMVLQQMTVVRDLMMAAARSIFQNRPEVLLGACHEIATAAAALQLELCEMQSQSLPATAREERNRLLWQLFAARAFFDAALRRWRRSLMLRRNLLRLRDESLSFDDAPLRWY